MSTTTATTTTAATGQAAAGAGQAAGAAPTATTKYCGACKEYHPVEDFWKVRKDGTELQQTCKKAMKEASRRYADKIGKEAMREIRCKSAKNNPHPLTPAQRQQQSVWRKAYYHQRRGTDAMRDIAPGRAAEAQERLVRYLNGELGKHPRQGRFLLRAQFCSACGKNDFVEGHHPVYEPNHLEDVQWLCVECHRLLHRYERLVQGSLEEKRREGLKRFLLKTDSIKLTASGKVRALRRSDFPKTSTTATTTSNGSTTAFSAPAVAPAVVPAPTTPAPAVPLSQPPPVASQPSSQPSSSSGTSATDDGDEFVDSLPWSLFTGDGCGSGSLCFHEHLRYESGDWHDLFPPAE